MLFVIIMLSILSIWREVSFQKEKKRWAVENRRLKSQLADMASDASTLQAQSDFYKRESDRHLETIYHLERKR